MKTSTIWKCATALAAAALVSGCVSHERTVVREPSGGAGTEVVVTEAPPLPEVETMTIAPGPGYVWVPGAWNWRSQWVWDHGHWAHPPRAGAVWVSPRYENRGDTRVFVRGGWKY